jgi:hypothetical protein
LPIERHEGLVELARRRSDLFSVSSSLVVQDSSNGFGAQVIRVELLVSGHHRLQDARVLVRRERPAAPPSLS